jgi:hypothetical protein
VLNCGNDRSFTITTANQTNTLATYYFGDRKLSDPTSLLTFEVDVDVVRRFGQFDPSLAHGITMPGNFNGWNSGALVLTPGTGSNTNIYSTTLTYNHYPIGACNVGFYKFFISGNAGARDGGWENPISTSAGNRSFSINSVAQTNHYYYNDENPVFNVTSIQKLDADKTKITWQSFPSRNNIPVGGQYAILSRDSVTDAWVTNGTVNSTASSSTFTNTGTTGIPNRFHRVSLIGL